MCLPIYALTRSSILKSRREGRVLDGICIFGCNFMLIYFVGMLEMLTISNSVLVLRETVLMWTSE